MLLPNMIREAVAALEQTGFRTMPQLCQANSHVQGPAALRATLNSVVGSLNKSRYVMQVTVFNNRSSSHDQSVCPVRQNMYKKLHLTL